MSFSSSQRSSGFMLSVTLFLLTASPVIAEDDSPEENLARYARHGAHVWARNPTARISGEGKACVSCHTSLPYALVEPLLSDHDAAYDELIENIDERARGWADNAPWYSEHKLELIAAAANLPKDTLKQTLNGPESRGSEAVLNALIRAMHDAYAQRPAERETQLAFENLWAEQVTSGPTAGDGGGFARIWCRGKHRIPTSGAHRSPVLPPASIRIWPLGGISNCCTAHCSKPREILRSACTQNLACSGATQKVAAPFWKTMRQRS